jgi:dTDP-4-amino-4,6-dideoxygalactose transaminase
MSDISVPLLDLHAQNGPLRDAVLAAVTRVCDSQRFIMGPEVEGFEKEIAAILGVTHAIGVSSGTDALLLAMMALGVGHGDEVVTPTYSFFATAGCVARLGATPVLVDIDPLTYNVDPAAVSRALTPRTKAILPVHLFGLSADMGSILEAAASAGVPVIEDACQAIGSTYRGSIVGGLGAYGCFSFFPSKNLGAFGDAGLVTTNDDTLAAKARLIRNHGQGSTYHHAVVGGNFRLDALQAAVLRVKAPHLAAWTAGRQRNARRYAELFTEYGLTSIVSLPVTPEGRGHIFNQFVVRVPRRDDLRKHLDAKRIGNNVYYPVPFHLQECFRSLGHAAGDFPHAEAAAASTVALPIFGELTEAQLRHVVASIAEFYEV